MRVLDNTRHELFAQNIAAGKTLAEAYVIAGFKDNHSNASTLAKNPAIAERVNQIKRIAAKAAMVTKERVLAEIASIAFADPPPPPVKMSDKRAALDTLAKHLGLTTERVDLQVSVSLADLVNGSYKLEQQQTPKVIEHCSNDVTTPKEPSDTNGL